MKCRFGDLQSGLTEMQLLIGPQNRKWKCLRRQRRPLRFLLQLLLHRLLPFLLHSVGRRGDRATQIGSGEGPWQALVGKMTVPDQM